jgi:hypothetical protein
MEVRYNVNGQRRKELVAAMAELLEAKPRYNGAPSFSYTVGDYLVDKQGMVSFSDFSDSEEVEMLLEGLAERGFECEAAFPEDSESLEQSANQPDDLPQTCAPEDPSAAPDGYSLTIEIPLTGFTPDKLNNLTRLVNAKAPLISMALGVDDLPIQIHDDRIAFPWFPAVDPKASDYSDRMAAYRTFVTLLCQTALNKTRINAKERETDNPKFAMRVWLISLGMVGAEYKTARKVMLRNLSGNSAFRSSAAKKEGADD